MQAAPSESIAAVLDEEVKAKVEEASEVLNIVPKKARAVPALCHRVGCRTRDGWGWHQPAASIPEGELASATEHSER